MKTIRHIRTKRNMNKDNKNKNNKQKRSKNKQKNNKNPSISTGLIRYLLSNKIPLII